ncbi:MAG TPA: glycine cleavage system aminomethyltransferase GcvT [Acidobacteriaceae bacterium]|nr:glycine cleavage system aminomethyltransferase GcvT [Acidobacteriaceae bacterium]
MALPLAPAPALRKTALNAVHRRLGARMVDFGGWDMPVEYSGITAEHLAVRTAVGLFDVSHMGDIQFRGPGSLAAVQAISMNDASRLAVGQAHYSAMLYPQGTFVDDILVHKLSENDYLLVINAGTREKDYQWIRSQAGSFPGVHISNYSDYFTQLAIQGPRAQETLAKLTKTDLSAIKNYWFTWGTVCGLPNVLIARTGYTGEDGFEIYIPSDEATSARVWDEVVEAGQEFGLLPCGLGARNTLRLEAAMALYGHEISEEINVFEAGLERYCKLEKGSFSGSDALRELQKSGGPKRRLVGLEMTERGIARDGYKVFSPQGEQIGYVTSGSPAPFLKKNIALAYVPIGFAAPGTELAVEVRSNRVGAKVVPTPFYRRPKKPV